MEEIMFEILSSKLVFIFRGSNGAILENMSKFFKMSYLNKLLSKLLMMSTCRVTRFPHEIGKNIVLEKSFIYIEICLQITLFNMIFFPISGFHQYSGWFWKHFQDSTPIKTRYSLLFSEPHLPSPLKIPD